jgi:hypothetical protein
MDPAGTAAVEKATVDPTLPSLGSDKDMSDSDTDDPTLPSLGSDKDDSDTDGVHLGECTLFR